MNIYTSSAPERLRAKKREGTGQETWSYSHTVINNYNSGQTLQANGQTAGLLGILPLRSKNWD